MKKPTWQFYRFICLSLLTLGVTAYPSGVDAADGKSQKIAVTPYVIGHFPSPDKKFIVRVVHDDGDVDNITIVDTTSGKSLVEASDVTDFQWVPGSSHRLVVGTSGLYGTAMLAMWDGGPHWQPLVKVRDPRNEAFTLYAVSRDGRLITYGHSRNIAGDLEGVDGRERRYRLRLPSPRRRDK